MKIFTPRQTNGVLKPLGVVWVNLILCIAVLLAGISAYLGIHNGKPITGLLFSTWLVLGGVYYVSVHHPYKTLHHQFHLPVALTALASLVIGIALVKLQVAI